MRAPGSLEPTNTLLRFAAIKCKWKRVELRDRMAFMEVPRRISELPLWAGALFIFVGLLWCFFGYRLYQVVFRIYCGVVFAAMFFLIAGFTRNLVLTAGAALVGGVMGVMLSPVLYHVNLALTGALAGAAVGSIAGGLLFPDAIPVAMAALGTLAAVAAIVYEKPIMIGGTALFGAYAAAAGGLVAAHHLHGLPKAPLVWLGAFGALAALGGIVQARLLRYEDRAQFRRKIEQMRRKKEERGYL